MSNTLKDYYDEFTAKFPEVKLDLTNLNEMKVILKNLINERVDYLTEIFNADNNLRNDLEYDLRNDLELVNLEDFYGMISREIANKNK